MNHIQTEFANLLSALGEDNFNSIVKEFNKEYYSAEDVRIVNGPYDGGIDLEIYKDGDQIKRNIQITVQKTKLDTKLKQDLKNAKENASKYSYQKSLDFYCSSSISGDQKRAWKRMAQVDFGIDLKLYDSKALASLAEDFKSIKHTLYRIIGVNNDTDLVKVDKHTKVLYDMFAIGKDTGELKRQFLHSLIITYIFENPNSTVEQVLKGLKKSISDKGNEVSIIQSQIDSLRSKGVIVNGSEKFQLDLEPQKKLQIQELLDTSSAQEGLLKQELENCLAPYHLIKETKKVVDFIYKTFTANYEADLEELSRNSNHNSNSIKKIYSDLIKFLNTKINDSEKSAQVAREVLEICSKNEFLNKIAASILFTKLYQSDKLEAYINQKKEFVLLDTQILLRILCLAPSQNKPDVFVKSVDDLMTTVANYRSRIFLQTSHEYVLELTKQIQDALKLERFFNLPIVQKFGGHTTNVIYNYYDLLKSRGLYDNDLKINDFVSDILGLPSIPNANSKEFSVIVSKQIEDIFGFLDIEVLHWSFHEDLIGIKREYEMSLQEKNKTLRAIENDSKSIVYLSDPDAHKDDSVNLINEPFLITWDKSFYKARKKVLEKFPHRGYWYIYTPAKFTDRLSLQNFQLNPISINNNIVSLTEVDFNTSGGITFIDLMSSLFDEEDLSKLEIAHKLIELENKTKPKTEESPNEEIKEDSALLRVLYEVRSHYLGKKNKFGIEDLIPTLENTANTEAVYDLIYSSVEIWRSKKQVDINLFKEFDHLIESTLKESEKSGKE